MTTNELAERLNLNTLVCGDEREVKGCYIGDLLSWVMSRAREGDAWITVMGNINSIGVAALTDSACIILCDDSPLDKDALERAQERDINIFSSSESAFELAVKISGMLS